MNNKKVQAIVMAASIAGTTLMTTALAANIALAEEATEAGAVKVITSDDADTTASSDVNTEDATQITLQDGETTVDGEAISSDSSAAVYAANDIIYYEDKDTYDSGNKYGEGEDADKHTAEEAAAETVIHITQAGTYKISGSLQGQIAVDLGEDARTNPEAVVTLIFDNADITCNVAPAVIFYNVYESDQQWVEADENDTEDYTTTDANVSTADAGANIVIADGSTNNITGAYVAKIFKDQEEEKKLYKYDGAVYSSMSMNVTGGEAGDGVLNITGSNEGLDSHVHLTINGGILNISGQDDGINTDEDNVSVTTINAGIVNVLGGLGQEGDGIDSNGYIVINGGTIVSTAKEMSDSGLDSTLGTIINGGTVFGSGSAMDGASETSTQTTMYLQFSTNQNLTDAVQVMDAEGNVVYEMDLSGDDFFKDVERTYGGLIISSEDLQQGETYSVEVGGTKMAYTSQSAGMGFPGGGQMPDFANGEKPELPEGMTEGENGEMRQMPNGENGERPELPEGMTEDENGEMPQMPNGENGEMPQTPNGENMQAPSGGVDETTAEPSADFTLDKVVNTFGGLQAAE